MYLTAQRVVSKETGQQGINSFIHLHRPHKQPKPISPADVVAVAESNTGKLIKENCEINPGGNHVKSYLDLVAPDTIESKTLVAALEKFKDKINQDEMGPIFAFIGVIGFRFNTEMELYKTLFDEYVILKDRAISLFRRAHK